MEFFMGSGLSKNEHPLPSEPLQVPTSSLHREKSKNLRRRRSHDQVERPVIEHRSNISKSNENEHWRIEQETTKMDDKKLKEKYGLSKDRVSLFRLGACSFVVCLLIFAVTRSMQHRDGGRHLIRRGQGANLPSANATLRSSKAADKLTHQDSSEMAKATEMGKVHSTHQDGKVKDQETGNSIEDSTRNSPKVNVKSTNQNNREIVQHANHDSTDEALNNLKTDAKSTDTDHRSVNQKCSFFGCTIIAPEASHLDNSNATNAISPKHFLLTHKSHRKLPQENQDRAILISPFVPEDPDDPKKKKSSSSSENFLIGTFNGHGEAGGDVAKFSMNELPLRIAQKLRDELKRSKLASTIDHDVVKKSIIQAHEETNEALPQETSRMGGCTANIVLRLGTTLYMSNVGDSYSYLVTYSTLTNEFHDYKKNANDLQHHLQGSIKIHHKNTRHQPHLPDESSRILSLGGRVHISESPKKSMDSHVIVKNLLNSSADEKNVGLATSRSIGDLEYTKIGVIPTPDVDVIDLKELFAGISDTSKLFVVVASDGLFDHRNMEFVTDHLAHILYESASSSDSMLKGMKNLVAAASSLESDLFQDDISFVVKGIEL